MSESQASVDGIFSYMVKKAGKPAYYLYEPESGPVARPETRKHAMPVLNGRRETLTLDRNGFEFVDHETQINDFYDNNEVLSHYYAEVEALVKRATGANRVLVFDHNQRHGGEEKPKGVREPVRFAHNDYTEESGPQRIRDLLPEEAETLLQHRYVFINVWRPIRGPIEEAPLAVCDASSMRPDDFVATDLNYSDRSGEIYSVAHRDGHRWIYFPKMKPDEALLLKCFDSERDGRARFTAHSAFDDPNTPESPAPRESIEARTVAFFAPA